MARSMGRAEFINSNFYHLPEEILIQILVRLPVKSLLRFKSVCQHWYSLITDSAFIQVHLKTSSQNSYIILGNYQYQAKYLYSIHYDDESFREYYEPQLPSHILKQSLSLHGSCNGLIPLSNVRGTICLWNLALRKLKTLPKSLILNSTSNLDHNYRRTTHVAFGFHPGVNDYKVVRIISYKNGYLTEVYSLSTDSWRRIDVAPSCFFVCWKPAIVNGAAYWVAVKKTDEGYCYLLVRFEMGDEVFEEVMLPDGATINREWSCH
ncbi:F-box protein At3g08750-like [Cornus florida]|uniref:F-box protein At3g08750-like n=1 Tax=Cornus florida TaxID=4283 RepID=UPI0028A15230|nr:F-box protein At3g08750-like [Cornus florida]